MALESMLVLLSLPLVASVVCNVQVPFGLIEAVVYTCIVYFIVGYERSPGYFFTFYLLCFSVMQVMAAIMRFNACASPNMVISNSAGTHTLSSALCVCNAWPSLKLQRHANVHCKACIPFPLPFCYRPRSPFPPHQGPPGLLTPLVCIWQVGHARCRQLF